jgi:hypothetical protein
MQNLFVIQIVCIAKPFQIVGYELQISNLLI